MSKSVNIIYIKPTYAEVDRMGYVYHPHFVEYCHRARSKIFNEIKHSEKSLEENNIMMPVVFSQITYKKPVHLDENITGFTSIDQIGAKLRFTTVFRNNNNEITTLCVIAIAFIKAETRKPMKIPGEIIKALKL